MTGGRLAVVAVLAVLVAGCSTEAQLREDGWAGSEQQPAPSATPSPVDDLFTCDRTFTRASDPPDDLVEQGGISEWAGGYVGDGFEVKRAASSPLGLVALVVGDEDRARAELTARGVALVGPWDEAESTRSVTPFAQVRALVEAQLTPVVAEVEAAVADLKGEYDVVAWEPNGEVVVQWADPVPPEVQALAGDRPGRVRVAVEAVPYSRADLDTALEALDGTPDVDPAAAHPCADGTGLVVGVDPDVLGERREQLQDELAEAAGVPVLVVPLADGA